MKISVLLILILFAGCATAPTESSKTCRRNLLNIDSAKEQCGMKYKMKVGDMMPIEKAAPFVRRPLDTLNCPDGGTISWEPLGTPPKCSIHGPLRID